MKRYYIGFANTFHDSALAIVNSDGDIVFAEATERYLQNKKAINASPDIFIRVSELIKANCDPDSDLVIAHTWSDEAYSSLNDLYKSLCEKEEESKIRFEEIPYFLKKELQFNKFIVSSMLSSLERDSRTLKFELSQDEVFCNVQIIPKKYNHHYTHAATACFTSNFSEGVCAVFDGYGEIGSHDFFTYKDGKIERLQEIEIESTASLGLFYWSICEACGFKRLAGDEWKVMGLAPYGQFDKKIYNILRPFLKVDGLSIKTCSEKEYVINHLKLNWIKRKQDDSPFTVTNLAYTGQHIFSEVYIELLNNLYDLGISENLILGGGCCLNSSANGKIFYETKFKNAYIPSAPADDGNAIGAALLAFYEDHPERKPSCNFQSPYLGSGMSDLTFENLKKFANIRNIKAYPGSIHEKAAELLSKGKIIGWIQGRAEFGPRALGNRSILADPRSPKIKDEINARVKFREEFRPLAPSILHDFGPEYFENYCESPYMERTLHYRKEVINKVPGVVHVGGTGRLQSVKKEWNEKFYLLIESFYEKTGIPLVLNTSYNIMGKPIVHSIEDVIAVFYTTGLDALVIGDYLIEKY